MDLKPISKIQYGKLTEKAIFNVALRAENLEYSSAVDELDPEFGRGKTAGYVRYTCGKIRIDYSPMEQIAIEGFRWMVNI